MKTKTGKRDMNPADAFRKEQRRKEVARNKLERKYVRGAAAKRDQPDELRAELAAIIEQEASQVAPLSKQLRLRKKALQDAFDRAVKAKRVRRGACVLLWTQLCCGCGYGQCCQMSFRQGRHR